MMGWLDWQWVNPFLLPLIALPAVIWFAKRFWQRKALTQYADAHLWNWVKVEGAHQVSGGFASFTWLWRWWQPSLFLSLAWICLIIALAGPRTPVPAPDEIKRSGVDILIAMDVSQSMQAQDLQPDRFGYGKAIVESFISQLESNDRLGLMVFAAKPHLVTPLTFDRDLLQHYLNLIEPKMLPTKGSLLKPALLFGAEHLQSTAGQAKVLLVLTDGEPEQWQAQELPAGFETIREQNIDIIVVGVGSQNKATLPDELHSSGLLHANGLMVKAPLEELSLKKLAQQVGGVYLKANSDMAFIEQLVAKSTEKTGERQLSSSQQVWLDHGDIFRILVPIFLLLAFYFGRIGWQKKSAASFALVILSSSVLLHSEQLEASPLVTPQQEAYQAYQLKAYDLSAQQYDAIGGYEGWLGAGAAAYKNEDMESAVQYFREAAVLGRNQLERHHALYNMGNAFYKANLLPQAVEAYEQALLYEADHTKTLHNLELAKQRRAIEEQQQGNPQQDEEGEGEGESRNQDQSGAFYGGQKADPNNSGEGVSGDSPDGNKDGKEFVLPDEEDRTDFNLSTPQRMQLSTEESQGNAILAQQKQRQQIELFEQKMQQVQDNQLELLKRLYEREEGFHARQTQAHPLPGVKPW